MSDIPEENGLIVYDSNTRLEGMLYTSKKFLKSLVIRKDHVWKVRIRKQKYGRCVANQKKVLKDL